MGVHRVHITYLNGLHSALDQDVIMVYIYRLLGSENSL